MKIKRPKMVLQSYEKIKYLLSIGLTNTQIEKIMKTSNGTIFMVKNSKSFEDYKAIAKEKYLENKLKYKTPHQLPIDTQNPRNETPKTEPSATPVYDVLVEIRDEVRTLNTYIRANGKSKGWKLF